MSRLALVSATMSDWLVNEMFAESIVYGLTWLRETEFPWTVNPVVMLQPL